MPPARYNAFRPALRSVVSVPVEEDQRAVAGALARKFDNVHYFHSYELVMHSQLSEVFLEDGRHVMPRIGGCSVSAPIA